MAGSRVMLVKPHQNLPTDYHSPPLGLLYLAGQLRERHGAEVRIVHMPVEGLNEAQLARCIREFRPDWLGISALTFESRGLHRVAALAKRVRPEMPVVAGGPHATFYTDDVLADPHVDYAVLGEGEVAVEKLHAALTDGRPVAAIAGLARRDGGRVVVNAEPEYVSDVDGLAFPAWDLVDLGAYRRFDRMSHIGTGNYVGLFTSRACPFGCIYCHNMFGRGFRPRSPENVLAEIRAAHDRHDVREFEIIDDCFNLDIDRAKRIFRLIIAAGLALRLSFPNGIRADRVDEEFMALARRAGVEAIAFGIETASPRLQKAIRKNLDLAAVARAIDLARRHRIFTLGFFMLGFPTETREEIRATIDFAARSQLHAANFFAVVPLAGTELAQWAHRAGKRAEIDFDQTYLTANAVNLTDLPDDELRRLRRWASVRFYARPARVWWIVRDFPVRSRLLRLPRFLVRRVALRP